MSEMNLPGFGLALELHRCTEDQIQFGLGLGLRELLLLMLELGFESQSGCVRHV